VSVAALAVHADDRSQLASPLEKRRSHKQNKKLISLTFRSTAMQTQKTKKWKSFHIESA